MDERVENLRQEWEREVRDIYEKKLKFTEAATFFHEAADLQEKGAPASRFRLSCLGAAAMCWLKAGEDEQFHSTVSNIRDELDRFQQADLPDQFSVLIAISDKLKGKSSYKLQREFASLRKQYWGQRMWARGYFACSTGNITDEMIKDYIANHGDQDDDFHVE